MVKMVKKKNKNLIGILVILGIFFMMYLFTIFYPLYEAKYKVNYEVIDTECNQLTTLSSPNTVYCEFINTRADSPFICGINFGDTMRWDIACVDDMKGYLTSIQIEELESREMICIDTLNKFVYLGEQNSMGEDIIEPMKCIRTDN